MNDVLHNCSWLSFLMYAALLWNGSHGAIQLCADGSYSRNGTTKYGTAGEQLRVEFCLENCNKIHPYVRMDYQTADQFQWFNILHPSDQNFGVTLMKDTQNKGKSLVNVTLRSVTPQDFDRTFKVHVYCDDGEKRWSSDVIFTFHLEENDFRSPKDGDKTSANTPGATVIKTTPPTSIKMTPSTTTTTTTTITTMPTTTMTKSLAPGCPTSNDFDCPGDWYALGNGKCMMVSDGEAHFDTRVTKKCEKHGADQLVGPLDDATRACVLHQLRESSCKYILLDSRRALNAENNEMKLNPWYGCSPEHYAHYTCIMDEHAWRPIITEFKLEVRSSSAEHPVKYVVDMKMDGETLDVEAGENLHFTCQVPRSTTSIILSARRYGQYSVLKKQQTTSSVDYTIEDADCEHTGLYICEGENEFYSTEVKRQIKVKCPVKITSFTAKFIERFRQDYGQGAALFDCTWMGNPAPSVVSLKAEANNTLSLNFPTHATSHRLTYVMNPVQCRDMGSYYCTAVAESTAAERKEELAVTDCPVQLCRSEERSKVIAAALGETREMSVCLMSSSQAPYLEKVLKTDTPIGKHRYTIHATKREESQIYYTVIIRLSDIQEEDYGTITLWLSNSHGSLRYNITVLMQDSRSQKEGEKTSADNLSTIAIQTTTPNPTKTTPTTTTTTTLGPSCLASDGFKCPRLWYSLGNGKCMMVSAFTVHVNTDVKGKCEEYGGEQLVGTLNDTTRACVLYQLRASRCEYILDVDLAGSWKDLNPETGVKTSSYGCQKGEHAHYACIIEEETWAPKITEFKLEVQKPSGGRHLVNYTIDLRIKEKAIDVEAGDILHFTCRVTGNPVPNLWLERLGGALNMEVPKSTHSVTYTVDNAACEHSGLYKCYAQSKFDFINVSNVINVKCPVKITSFTVRYFTGFRFGAEMVDQGGFAMIECVWAGSPAPDVVSLKDETNKTLSLEFPAPPLTQTLTYRFTEVQCRDMGVYYCTVMGESTSVERKDELLVSDCPVQFCRSETRAHVIGAALGETKEISVCLVSFSRKPYIVGVFKDDEQIELHKYTINAKRRGDSRIYYTAIIKISDIQEEDYGTYTILLRNYGEPLKYNITVVPPGQPECPSNIQATNQNADYITLSWQPEFDGGADQSLHVYYSSDNVTWKHMKAPEEAKTMNVSSLTEATEYAFRVVSSNKYRTVFDQTTCESTIVSRTATRSPPRHTTETSGEVSQVRVIVAVISVVLIADIIVLGAVIYRYR